MVECPVCLRDFPLPPDPREGDIVICPHCKEELRLVLVGGRWEAVRAAR